jgi:hypothetical protein
MRSAPDRLARNPIFAVPVVGELGRGWAVTGMVTNFFTLADPVNRYTTRVSVRRIRRIRRRVSSADLVTCLTLAAVIASLTLSRSISASALVSIATHQHIFNIYFGMGYSFRVDDRIDAGVCFFAMRQRCSNKSSGCHRALAVSTAPNKSIATESPAAIIVPSSRRIIGWLISFIGLRRPNSKTLRRYACPYRGWWPRPSGLARWETESRGRRAVANMRTKRQPRPSGT